MTSPEPSVPRGGGFLLSPPASSPSTSTITSRTRTALPQPRHTPLRAGGSKESTFIRYVDARLLHLQRRFAKRTTATTSLPSPDSNGSNSLRGISTQIGHRDKGDAWGDVQGYASMREACRDVTALVDVIWVSGTPSLQVPYLIGIGLFVGDVLAAMPPSPRSLFRVLGRLDHAFASLLLGRDVESGERLPGFFGVKGVSGTEKVRIRSMVERTRVSVVEVFKRGEFEFEEPEEEGEGEEGKGTDGEMEGELVLEGGDHELLGDEDDSFDMQIARVYDKTMIELGDSLMAPNIGIITESRGQGPDVEMT